MKLKGDPVKVQRSRFNWPHVSFVASATGNAWSARSRETGGSNDREGEEGISPLRALMGTSLQSVS